MSDTSRVLDEFAAAAHGLAITAGGSALNNVLDQSACNDPVSAMRNITRLLEKAEKATTCMVIAQKAEAEGDKELAERSWSHALTTMNLLAVEASKRSYERPISHNDSTETAAQDRFAS
jgi:hypothetical protein